MKKRVSIPIVLVSITAVAFGLATVPKDVPSGQKATVNGQSITENSTMGFDYEYAFTLPEIRGNARLVIRLPESARLDPVILFTDDTGSREFYDQPEVMDREIIYKDVKAGSYHFVYTSPNGDDTLDETSVAVEE